ncbi:MAG: transporter of the superfamily [Burkholderiaceae bacterium]|nr:transporter of the superfamily [Burkholderiaceae bacterium]
MVRALVSPMTLNLLRWAIAMVILMPLAGFIFRSGSELWGSWKRFAILGLLSVGLYNSLQYLALQSSSPINVTLVAASMPFWMLLIGKLFYGVRIGFKRVVGAVLSIAGVLLVLSRGEWHVLLAMHLVPGDLYMIVATIAWACYSWMLTRPKEPESIRGNWSAFLMAQIGFGVIWSAVFTAGEWAIGSHRIEWSWGLAAALLFVAIGPAIIALRCWGMGVQRAGPTVAGFFSNLTPLFAAIFSAAFLGETPHLYHLAAFGMIVGGIVFSAQR